MALGACFVTTQGYAAGGGGSHMKPADIDPDNVASLQRGARNFMNYCSGCHSAQYVRYNTIGKTLNLSEEQLIGQPDVQCRQDVRDDSDGNAGR